MDSQAFQQPATQRTIPQARNAWQVTRGFVKCREARVQAAVVLAVWLAVLLLGSRQSWAPLLSLLGYLAWYLVEIPAHRFFLHMPVPANPRLHGLVRRLHYAHHERPSDPALLFLPEWVTLPGFAIILGVAAAAGYLHEGLWYLAGYVTALSVYEWMHYAAHSAWQPSWGPIARTLQDHLRHHFHNDSYWFGVSNRLMDRLWASSPPPASVPRNTPLRKRSAPQGPYS